ncbi:MAG TPA: hypothetical protein VGB70_02995 [Allosphingosinicella sp.]|jgi:hypothetical protein
MNKLTISLIGAASVLAATPALAQDTATTTGSFTGPRVGVTVGTGGDDFVDFDGQTIGVELGYDAEVNGVVAGVSVEYQTDLGDAFFDVNETALMFRAGGKVTPNALLYATGGLTVLNTGSTPFSGDSDKGARFGVGAEFGLGNSGALVKLEQRYYTYGNNTDAFQTVAGIGFRF